jgi:diguanylate cyclase (GGDEF)-like protein
MCDVDHFKKINDSHGHLTGDEVLKWFASSLQKCVRKTDWIARYGGEEFVIVLPETNVGNATVAAEHLRAHVADTPFASNGMQFCVTASFGVSGWKDAAKEGTSLDALIARCDAGVYASKAGGRNRVNTESID